MSKKDVIYIDIEDDITSIIDKVKASHAEIVALVPPKRSSVLQSTVNMKLLKRSADKDNKKVVLISSEASLMPLAGGAGLFMADSLQSRPKIPEIEKPDIDETEIEDDQIIDSVDDAEIEADASAVKPSKPDKVAAKPKEKSEKLKSLKSNSKIPNFSKFRLRMILVGVGLVSLIALWFVGFKIMPTANVVIKAQTKRVPVDANLTIATTVQTNIDEGLLAASQETMTKDVSQEFDATGEKDVGKKASGTVTLQNCYSSTALSVPAGTTITDPSSGAKFTTNSDVTVPGAVFFGACLTPGEEAATVTAVESGDDKNLSPRSYTVGGYGGKVTGFGEQLSGGTTKKVKVIAQSDIDAAIKKVQERSHDEQKTEVSNQFDSSNLAIVESFSVTGANGSSSPVVNTEASKGTVTVKFSYVMAGVKKDDLNAFLEKTEKAQLGEGDQNILETGLDEVTIAITTKTSDTNMIVNIKANGFAGPKIDENAIKEQIKGMRYSEAISTIKDIDGVNEVEIDLAPFWVSHVPGRTSRTTVSVEVSDHTLQ